MKQGWYTWPQSWSWQSKETELCLLIWNKVLFWNYKWHWTVNHDKPCSVQIREDPPTLMAYKICRVKALQSVIFVLNIYLTKFCIIINWLHICYALFECRLCWLILIYHLVFYHIKPTYWFKAKTIIIWHYQFNLNKLSPNFSKFFTQQAFTSLVK